MKNLCFTCLMCTGLLVEAAADFTPQWCISKSNAKYVKIEEYGWDWTYHSFREALWWNPEQGQRPLPRPCRRFQATGHRCEGIADFNVRHSPPIWYNLRRRFYRRTR